MEDRSILHHNQHGVSIAHFDFFVHDMGSGLTGIRPRFVLSARRFSRASGNGIHLENGVQSGVRCEVTTEDWVSTDGEESSEKDEGDEGWTIWTEWTKSGGRDVALNGRLFLT